MPGLIAPFSRDTTVQPVQSDPYTQPSGPELRYFIKRNNGTNVPLIPADELPHIVRLQGVPRFFKAAETGDMCCVGHDPFTGRFFGLDTSGLEGFPPVSRYDELSPPKRSGWSSPEVSTLEAT